MENSSMADLFFVFILPLLRTLPYRAIQSITRRLAHLIEDTAGIEPFLFNIFDQHSLVCCYLSQEAIHA